MKLEKAVLFRSINAVGESAEKTLDKNKIPYTRIFDESPEVLLITDLGAYQGIPGINSYIRAYNAGTE